MSINHRPALTLVLILATSLAGCSFRSRPLPARPPAAERSRLSTPPASGGSPSPSAALPAGNVDNELSAGPLTLEIYSSKTADLFHVVDQVSQWSEFCHRQYLAYFENLDGGLSPEDRGMLAEHAGIRKTHGWGGGLEQTFYTPLDLEAALAQAVKNRWLSEAEAQTERRVLAHFQARVERLTVEQALTLRKFERELSSRQTNLVAFANTLSRFAGKAALRVPVFLIPNPDANSFGGGYNGGRLTVELPAQRDVYTILLHELFHAFVSPKKDLIQRAAKAVPGLAEETLNEGLAYAYQPGLIHPQGSDPLLIAVHDFLSRGGTLQDAYTRFNLYGLALRPLLADALADPHQALETFLPRATDAWLALAELEKARAASTKPQKVDYQKDPRHSIFVFEPPGVESGLCGVGGGTTLGTALQRHLFGRNHVADAYREMLTKNAKPGDWIILLLALDNSEQVPEEFADLMPVPWSELEPQLKANQTVFRQKQARGMTVFLLAAPTIKELKTEYQRLVAEKKFQPHGS